MSDNGELIEVDKMSIDQLAGAVVLVLGAVGSLLLVIWQSRCACRCRIGCSDKCYIFDCSREPPPDEAPKEDETLVPPEDEEPDSRPVAQYNTRRRPEEPAENAE
jgi:hypothetical protein